MNNLFHFLGVFFAAFMHSSLFSPVWKNYWRPILRILLALVSIKLFPLANEAFWQRPRSIFFYKLIKITKYNYTQILYAR